MNPSTSDTPRSWEDILDRQAAGDPVAEEELAWLRERARDDAELRGELELVECLPRLFDADPGPDSVSPASSSSDDEFIARVVAAAAAEDRAARRRRGAMGWGLAAAAAAVALLALRGPALDSGPSGSRGSLEATPPVVAQAGPAPSQVVPELEEGSLLLTPAASERLLAGAAVPFDRWLRAAPGEDACVRAAPGGKLCASPGSLLRLRHGAHLSAEVASGRLRLGVATGASISVPEAAAPAGDPEAARLRVTVDGSSVLLVVLVGPVLLEGPEGPRILTTGEEARLTFEAAIAAARRADEAPTEAEAEAAPAAQPPAPAPALSGRRGLPRDAASTSPAELLAAAQELRAAGDLRGAKSAYAELVRKHPSSAEARAALPSLGDLQLRAGRPRDALRTFEAYLQGGGATVEEARRGRIAALGALGRRGDEVAAIAEFLAQHPDSLHAGRLRARLGELESAR